MSDEIKRYTVRALRDCDIFPVTEEMVTLMDHDQALAARDETIRQQAEEIDRLKNLLKRAGLQCFFPNGTAEEVAAHMEAVAASHIRHQKQQAEQIAELRDTITGLEAQKKNVAERAALMICGTPCVQHKAWPSPTMERALLGRCQVCDLEELRLHRQKAKGEYWVWQGDGEDDLESLACPVLIRADDLRLLVERETKALTYGNTNRELIRDMEPFVSASPYHAIWGRIRAALGDPAAEPASEPLPQFEDIIGLLADKPPQGGTNA
jgi:hypothetical protein